MAFFISPLISARVLDIGPRALGRGQGSTMRLKHLHLRVTNFLKEQKQASFLFFLMVSSVKFVHIQLPLHIVTQH
jgi:hypothetical protein